MVHRARSGSRSRQPVALLAIAGLLGWASALSACTPTPTPTVAEPTDEATAIAAGPTAAPTATTRATATAGDIVMPTSEVPESDPEAKATGLYDAWRRGDRDTAATLAEPEAVETLFGRLWRATDGWEYDGCEGAAGSTYCTWHTTAGKLIVRVRNPGAGPPSLVTEVRFEVNTPAATGVSGASGSPTVAVTVAAPATRRPTTAPTARPTGSGASGDAGTVLRRANWLAVLRNTPGLVIDPTVPSAPGHEGEPFVNISALTDVGGYAVIGSDRILYTDISGDGIEEAIISLASGGTAGNTALLVFQAVSGQAKLADTLAGYKIGGVADRGQLRVLEPIYAGWEPNCCPSGEFETTYRLVGGKLAQQSRREQPYDEAKRMTVEHFYDLLGQKNYADAYNQFLGESFRRANPFEPWKAGYQKTTKFDYETSDRPDGSVAVKLTATDQTAGGSVVRRFEGTWRLKWVSTARLKQWVLEAGSFQEVK